MIVSKILASEKNLVKRISVSTVCSKNLFQTHDEIT